MEHEMQIEKLTILEKLMIVRDMIERGELIYDDFSGLLRIIKNASFKGTKIKVY